jgi:excisionase family DNA binding protein
MKTENKQFYTAHEIATLLSLNVMTVYRYIKGKRLIAHKIGKEYRINHTDFERFLAKTKTK